MRRLILIGRWFMAAALIGWGVQNFIYGDFVLGRAPAWPAGVPGRAWFAGISGGFFILTGSASAIGVASPLLAIAGAAIVLVWALLRHLVAFLPHFNTGAQFTDTGKALTLFGGLLTLAALTPPWFVWNSDTENSKISTRLVLVGRVCLGFFMIDSGIQHVLWAQYVAPLVPAWIGHGLGWTYVAGVFLIAGGLGLLLPWTARLAAACSGLMIFLWFVLLHVPRSVAFPHSQSDWLAVFESLGFSGIAWCIAGALTPAERRISVR